MFTYFSQHLLSKSELLTKLSFFDTIKKLRTIKNRPESFTQVKQGN